MLGKRRRPIEVPGAGSVSIKLQASYFSSEWTLWLCLKKDKLEFDI